MSDDEAKASDLLSVKEMQQWLSQEVRDTAKAHELRLKEANAFVADYASGVLNAEQAQEKLAAYDRRWGEALFGAAAVPGVTDEEIVNRIDRARAETRVDRLSTKFGSPRSGRQASRE